MSAPLDFDERVGVENYLPEGDVRPDLFQAEEVHWSFPCGMCVNRHRKEDDFCLGCRHFAL